MSITRDYGEVVFECDSPNCVGSLETGVESFEVALSKLRQAGWQEDFFQGNWRHYCKDCGVAF